MVMRWEAFLDQVRERGAYESTEEAERATRTVLALLGAHLVGGVRADLAARLPEGPGPGPAQSAPGTRAAVTRAVRTGHRGLDRGRHRTDRRLGRERRPQRGRRSRGRGTHRPHPAPAPSRLRPAVRPPPARLTPPGRQATTPCFPTPVVTHGARQRPPATGDTPTAHEKGNRVSDESPAAAVPVHRGHDVRADAGTGAIRRRLRHPRPGRAGRAHRTGRLRRRQVTGEERVELAARLPYEAAVTFTSQAPAAEALSGWTFVKDLASSTGGSPATTRWDTGTVLRVVARLAGEGLLSRVLTQLPSGYALLFGRAELTQAA